MRSWLSKAEKSNSAVRPERAAAAAAREEGVLGREGREGKSNSLFSLVVLLWVGLSGEVVVGGEVLL